MPPLFAVEALATGALPGRYVLGGRLRLLLHEKGYGGRGVVGEVRGQLEGRLLVRLRALVEVRLRLRLCQPRRLRLLR